MDKLPKDVGRNCVFTALEYLSLKSGIIELRHDIHDINTQSFLSKLLYLVERNTPTAKILITSPGGSVYQANAMFDRLIWAHHHGTKSIGIVEGFAASAASMIVLQGCTQRLATPTARLHMHEPSQWIVLEQLKASTLDDEVKEMQALTKNIVKVIACRAHKSETEVFEFFKRRERWMSAKEALDWGFIDGIYL
jgi:ATP-dependent protease ClpP protease subunit